MRMDVKKHACKKHILSRQASALVHLDPSLKNRFFALAIPKTFILSERNNPAVTGERLPDTLHPHELEVCLSCSRSHVCVRQCLSVEVFLSRVLFLVEMFLLYRYKVCVYKWCPIRGIFSR